MVIKPSISSPLEAGISILDTHPLPSHLEPALEHISRHLAARSLHVTLVAVRRDYQLPPVGPPRPTDLSSAGRPASALAQRFGFATAAASPVKALKNLVRPESRTILRATTFVEPSRSAISSPARTPASPNFPQLQSAPSSAALSPLPPLTPCTTASVTTDTTGSMEQHSFGLRLVHSESLAARDERALQFAIHRAGRKLNIGREWLSPALQPTVCGVTKELFHSSVAQNDVLFASDGLSIVSLEGLYSLKSALSSYSKTKASMRLEDAVDELRRYILANNGRKVVRSDLRRSYDWLRVTDSALTDVDLMYKRAYGGPEEAGAISGMPKPATPIVPEPEIKLEPDDVETEFEDDAEGPTIKAPVSKTPIPPKSPRARIPVLKLQTSFDEPHAKPSQDADSDGDRTARAMDHVPIMLQPWNPMSSIDFVMSAGIASPGGHSMRLGPNTPNGYDDISPVTRGEWGFLMVDNPLQVGRTVPVETFGG